MDQTRFVSEFNFTAGPANEHDPEQDQSFAGKVPDSSNPRRRLLSASSSFQSCQAEYLLRAQTARLLSSPSHPRVRNRARPPPEKRPARRIESALSWFR